MSAAITITITITVDGGTVAINPAPDTPARSAVADTPDCVGSAPGANSDATPRGRVDGAVQPAVPPRSTSQAEGVGSAPVTLPPTAGIEGSTTSTASLLRAQIPSSTDKDRLEREARLAEGDGLEIPGFLRREKATA